MSIAVNINGKDYYDKEEARAAWFEEWLMKQDFEQDLIDRENELEYRRVHPDWNIPYVMYGLRKKHKCIKKKEIAFNNSLTCNTYQIDYHIVKCKPREYYIDKYLK